MQEYFINESIEHHFPSGTNGYSGYWKPHTASIDFCETNYLLSPYIVEPHNVWSSLLGLSFFGFVGILCGNPTREPRVYAIYLVLVLIGVGSAALHATLHWIFQSSDELPMIYLVLCGIYCCLEVDSQPNKAAYPSLGLCLTVLSIVNTAIYFTFQHLYIVFLSTFMAAICLFSFLHMRLAYRLWHIQKRKEANGSKNNKATITIALRFYVIHFLLFVLLGTPIWIIDQFLCNQLSPTYDALPFLLRGCTLHVVWHILSGMAVHCLAQYFVAARAEYLGMETCEVRWVGGVIPVVAFMDKKK